MDRAAAKMAHKPPGAGGSKTFTVHQHMDSRVAMAFLNRLGGKRSRILCAAALDFWKEILANKGWIRASWLSRELNEQADLFSKFRMKLWDF